MSLIPATKLQGAQRPKMRNTGHRCSGADQIRPSALEDQNDISKAHKQPDRFWSVSWRYLTGPFKAMPLNCVGVIPVNFLKAE